MLQEHDYDCNCRACCDQITHELNTAYLEDLLDDIDDGFRYDAESESFIRYIC